MRSRERIENARFDTDSQDTAFLVGLVLEVLLDIRDLLTPDKIQEK